MGTSRSSRPTRGPGNGAGGGRDRASGRRTHLNHLIEVVIVRARGAGVVGERPGEARRVGVPARLGDEGHVAFDSEVGEVEPANRARGRATEARDGRVRGWAQSRRGERECRAIAHADARVDQPAVDGGSRRGSRRRGIFRASATKKIRAAGRGRGAHLRSTRALTRGSCARRGYPTRPRDRTSSRRIERERHGRGRRRFRTPSGRWRNGKMPREANIVVFRGGEASAFASLSVARGRSIEDRDSRGRCTSVRERPTEVSLDGGRREAREAGWPRSDGAVV